MPAWKRKRVKALLQIDFGGPLANDALIERTRMRTALRAAKGSGLLSKIERNALEKDPALSSDVGRVSRKEFIEAYERGKTLLKKPSKEGEAYDDVNRVAATLLEAAKAKGWRGNVDYTDLAKGIDRKTRNAFVRKLSRPVRAATERSINKQAFEAIARIIHKAKAKKMRIKVDLVTDNNPELYRASFQKALRIQAKKFAGESGKKLPKPRYRKKPKGTVGKLARETMLLLAPAGKSRAYISGENWGNKANPETWKRILKDRKVEAGERVVFVDDSLAKLKGFYEGTKAFGARPVAVWLDLKKEASENLTGNATREIFPHFTIHDIMRLEDIV